MPPPKFHRNCGYRPEGGRVPYPFVLTMADRQVALDQQGVKDLIKKLTDLL